MDLIQVRITGLISTTRYGNLQPGDLLRTDAAFARHLVEDCAAAEYITAPSDEATSPAHDTKPKRAKKAKDEPQ